MKYGIIHCEYFRVWVVLVVRMRSRALMEKKKFATCRPENQSRRGRGKESRDITIIKRKEHQAREKE